ncbi:MAG: hypothetical protein GY725_21730 [bacterium]|nr:hypothetical protein [bacterium]
MASTAPRRSERHRVALVILVLLATGGPAVQAAPPDYELTPRLYRSGDDPAWATATSLDDWSTVRPRDSPNWWFRTSMAVQRDAEPLEDVALRVFAPGAFEVYWDGELIGRNGVIGTDRRSEVPGRHGSWLVVDPDRVAAGEHRVAVRVSSHHIGRVRGPVGVQLLDRAHTERWEGRRTALFLLCAGVLLLAGIVFASLYRATGARVDTLLFAILALAVALLLVLEYSKFLWAYPYPWHFPRLIAISSLTIAVGALLPVFVTAHLGFGRLRLLATVLVVLYATMTVLFTDPDVHSLNILRTAIGVAFVAGCIGIWKKRSDAAWMLAGVTVTLIPAFLMGFRYADHGFFVGFLAMVAVLLTLMARTLRRQAEQRTAALLTAERLRYELLRKTIQPHFLMNSLAVSISRIEEQPELGIEVLRSLAEELQAFLHIGERNRTTVREELELCRKHARTMAHLLDRPLELCVDGDVADDPLPPGVLLTLVENAITHGDPVEDPRIRVVVSRNAAGLVIEVRNRAQQSSAPSREGAGLRYVRAQLRHADGNWDFADGCEAGEWWARINRRSR